MSPLVIVDEEVRIVVVLGGDVLCQVKLLMVLLPAGGKFFEYAWVQIFFEHKHSKAFNVKDDCKELHMRIAGVNNKDAVNKFSN